MQFQCAGHLGPGGRRTAQRDGGHCPARPQSRRPGGGGDAFFRQELELLPAALPDALRAHSSSLLTDLTAQDLLILEDTLEFLADRSAAIHTEALPGEWDGECYTLTDDSRAAVQALFNVSPTEAQLSSASEP